MTELGDWVGVRLAAAPASLRERITVAVASLDPSPPPEALASVLRGLADRMVEEVKQADASRGLAGSLLAADALMTLACEAECLSRIE